MEDAVEQIIILMERRLNRDGVELDVYDTDTVRDALEEVLEKYYSERNTE